MRRSIYRKIYRHASSLARRLLDLSGLVAFRKSSNLYLPEENLCQVVVSLIDTTTPTVIDGGSHHGDMVEKFSRLLPDSRFICFEPNSSLADLLMSRYRNNNCVTIVQSALGETSGSTTFNINSSEATSSILDTSANLDSQLAELCHQVKQIKVPIVSIDEYCRTNGITSVDVLKLDLQGYDYLALKGARDTIKNVRCILVELMFSDIYKGSASFDEIFALMKEFGLKLFTLGAMKYSDNSQLLWCDAIFVRS